MSNFDRNKIKEVLKPIVKSAFEAEKHGDKEMRKNTIDVFSATIESTIKGISMEEWLKQERQRQVQKTLQNQIGELHQKILGTLPGVENLGTGQIVDLKIDDRKAVAEIKNKHNTTKGNHKKNVYDDIAACLPQDKEGVGYYVEILPKNGKAYNQPFTPSDNVSKTKRASNEKIRQIDGNTFYGLLADDPNALREVYEMLPGLTAEILKEEFNEDRNPSEHLAIDEFERIYGKPKKE